MTTPLLPSSLTTSTPEAAYPILDTEAGHLIGPVLVGPPEVDHLRRVLLEGGCAALIGYNGLVRVHASREQRRVELHANAERLLSAHCGPEWIHRQSSLHALRALLRAVNEAPKGEIAAPIRVHGNGHRLHLGAQTVRLPENLTGRYRTLIEDLRGDAVIPGRWYGQFEVSTRANLAFVEAPHGNAITERHMLAAALEDALSPSQGGPS